MGMDRKARAVIAGAITSPGFLCCGGAGLRLSE